MGLFRAVQVCLSSNMRVVGYTDVRGALGRYTPDLGKARAMCSGGYL